MATKKEKQELRDNAVATLAKMGVVQGATVYAEVSHVSKSGMSRNIRLFVVDPRTNELENITALAARALGDKWHEDSLGRHVLKIGGCGFDACFYAVYNLGRCMFPSGGDVEKSVRVHQEKRAGETIEKDGGYLLKQRTL